MARRIRLYAEIDPRVMPSRKRNKNGPQARENASVHGDRRHDNPAPKKPRAKKMTARQMVDQVVEQSQRMQEEFRAQMAESRAQQLQYIQQSQVNMPQFSQPVQQYMPSSQPVPMAPFLPSQPVQGAPFLPSQPMQRAPFPPPHPVRPAQHQQFNTQVPPPSNQGVQWHQWQPPQSGQSRQS